MTLDIPPGWRRTESGQYNEWMAPDGQSDFRIAIMRATPTLHGPNAAAAVQSMFQSVTTKFNARKQVVVQTIQVCNGTEPAYRIDDPLGDDAAGFMVVIPGSDSSGLVNYEIRPGGQVDPAILKTIAKMCWP